MRSARSTDLLFAQQVGRPLFSYSGANRNFAALVAKAPLVDVGVGRCPTAYHRQPGRPAPYNLFSETKTLFGSAGDNVTPPPPLFSYRPAGEAPPEAGSEPAPRVQALWKLNITTTVVFAWDEASKTFHRSTDGAPHLDAAGVQVATQNVVFQVVGYRNTGLVDQSGAAVPEAELIGEGDAWVLTAGRLVKGRWSRPTDAQTTAFTYPSGEPIRLAPGPPGSSSSLSGTSSRCSQRRARARCGAARPPWASAASQRGQRRSISSTSTRSPSSSAAWLRCNSGDQGGAEP